MAYEKLSYPVAMSNQTKITKNYILNEYTVYICIQQLRKPYDIYTTMLHEIKIKR